MNLNAILGLGERKIVLASASPRRVEILQRIGLTFEARPSNFDENNATYEIPEVFVLELSQQKAAIVAENINDGVVIGMDTIVVLNEMILGKPQSQTEAKQMLRRLSGQTHVVYTGFAILDRPSGKIINDFDKTSVTFRILTDEEIEAYATTGSPMDKAGSYGIQDQGAMFVYGMEGCFYNVMGLPVTKLCMSLRSLNPTQIA